MRLSAVAAPLSKPEIIMRFISFLRWSSDIREGADYAFEIRRKIRVVPNSSLAEALELLSIETAVVNTLLNFTTTRVPPELTSTRSNSILFCSQLRRWIQRICGFGVHRIFF
jgi:hypothetical protein